VRRNFHLDFGLGFLVTGTANVAVFRFYGNLGRAMEAGLDQLGPAFSAIDAVGAVVLSAFGAFVERKEIVIHFFSLKEDPSPYKPIYT
jgi:hypothetical protein